MKVLVTGGAGFIGSHVVRNLLSEGYEFATAIAMRWYGWRAITISKTNAYSVDCWPWPDQAA